MDFRASQNPVNILLVLLWLILYPASGEALEPGEVLVTLGYAGWSAGQIEWELSQNAWLTVAADPRILFDMQSEERLPAAMQLLGVDFASLSEVAGHA